MKHEFILVLDFGSQYNQLITRRVRELGVYSELHDNEISIEEIKKMNPKGIILSGGPNSVYEENSLTIDDDYLYEKFGVEKPKDYDKQKQQKAREEKLKQQTEVEDSDDIMQTPTIKSQPSKFKNRLRSFFVRAPKDGARLDW